MHAVTFVKCNVGSISDGFVDGGGWRPAHLPCLRPAAALHAVQLGEASSLQLGESHFIFCLVLLSAAIRSALGHSAAPCFSPLLVSVAPPDNEA